MCGIAAPFTTHRNNGKISLTLVVKIGKMELLILLTCSDMFTPHMQHVQCLPSQVDGVCWMKLVHQQPKERSQVVPH